MKLRTKLIVSVTASVVAVIGLILVIITGFLILPTPNTPNEDGPNINYIAPYINNTHSCYTHGPTCTGELANQLINYTVWSTDSLISITSFGLTEDNGFFRLDLEIDKSYNIEMQTIFNSTTYTGTTNFSTTSGSANCITDGQLKL